MDKSSQSEVIKVSRGLRGPTNMESTAVLVQRMGHPRFGAGGAAEGRGEGEGAALVLT